MAEVVLFHPALGLTPGVVAFADELRGAGHTVHTPDLFEGRTFATIDEGVGHAQQIGFGEVMQRGARAVEDLPAEPVYAGFSLGVVPAQMLAQTRPGARGARSFHSCAPVSEPGPARPGPARWGPGAGARDGRRPELRRRGRRRRGPRAGRAGGGHRAVPLPRRPHYFADSSQPSYDAAATALLTERVLAFLADR
ncbi:MAG: hypothetical protein JWQ26_3193 [Modestobacter sp.]|nr:hypothetical protein [Modestobacter sp.]